MNIKTLCLMLLMACLFWLAGQETAWAGMPLLRRQMFGSTGALNTGSEGGGFQTVTGQFHQRPGGPSAGGSAPASGDLRFESGSIHGTFVTEDTSDGKFFLGAWFFVKSLRTDSGVWLAVCDINGNAGPVISEFHGKLGAGIMYGTWTPLPKEPVNQWIYLGIAVNRTGDGIGSVRFYYRFLGQPMNQWAAIDNADIGIGSLGQFLAGCLGNNPASQMRLGAPSLYKFESNDFSDVVYPADLDEPSTRLTWYCDPAAGNDGNDGLTPATAWKTAEKINQESLYTGFLSADSHTSGDTLVVNTGGAMLDLNSVALTFLTSGLNIHAAEGQQWIRIKSYRSLPATVWIPCGIPNVYATADTQADVVVWENDRFLNHPKGPFLQDVADLLASIPGSFWTDGTTMYLHPFGSTDPRSDGKRYERSCNWGTTGAVMLSAKHLSVSDLHVGKTCLAASADNDPIGSYCLGTGSGLGQAVITHCYLYYGSKHNIGITLGDVGDYVIIDDVQAEQGSPYAGPGGQTMFVSFNHLPQSLGIVHSYRRCRTTANSGVIGSSKGVNTPYYPVFYSHNLGAAGEPNQFARIQFLDCDFGAGVLSGGAVTSVELAGTKCGQVSFSGDVVAERCEIRGMILPGGSRSVTEKNCFHVLFGALARQTVAGRVDLQACTFDARNVTGADFEAALFNRSGQVDFTFHNNLVLMPPDFVRLNVFSDFTSSDALQFSHNAYSLGGRVLSYHFDQGGNVQNKSLEQWQELGFDQYSLNVTGLLLEKGIPVPGSVLIDAGLDLGPAEDCSGSTFHMRNDIGAFETPPATFETWQVENFSDELLKLPETVSEKAAYLGDGVTNLEKYFAGISPADTLPHGILSGKVVQMNGISRLFEIRLMRSRYQSDVDLKMELSTDLKYWIPFDGSPQEIKQLSTQVEEQVFYIPAGNASRSFFRCSLFR